MGVSGIQFIGKFSSERTFIRFFITVMKRLRILLCKNYCNPRIKLELKWIQTSRLKKLKCIQEENRKATPIFEIELLYFNIGHKGFLILSFDPTAFTKVSFTHHCTSNWSHSKNLTALFLLICIRQAFSEF